MTRQLTVSTGKKKDGNFSIFKEDHIPLPRAEEGYGFRPVKGQDVVL